MRNEYASLFTCIAEVVGPGLARHIVRRIGLDNPAGLRILAVDVVLHIDLVEDTGLGERIGFGVGIGPGVDIDSEVGIDLEARTVQVEDMIAARPTKADMLGAVALDIDCAGGCRSFVGLRSILRLTQPASSCPACAGSLQVVQEGAVAGILEHLRVHHVRSDYVGGDRDLGDHTDRHD